MRPESMTTQGALQRTAAGIHAGGRFRLNNRELKRAQIPAQPLLVPPSDGEQSFGATPINFGRRIKAQTSAESMVLVLNGDGSVACSLSARALADNVCRTTNA
jgi:hypothetical protein